jgi:hypothetical protein
MSKKTILIIGGALGLATILFARKKGERGIYAFLPGLIVFAVVSGMLARSQRANEELNG